VTARVNPSASSRQRQPALTATTIANPHAFIRANTRLRPVPLVPEIAIYVADESVCSAEFLMNDILSAILSAYGHDLDYEVVGRIRKYLQTLASAGKSPGELLEYGTAYLQELESPDRRYSGW
jgi:hypothetical protein